MKRIMAASLILLGTVLVTTARSEGSVKYGLGYVRPEAPVGGRVWFTDKVGADLGLGFDSKKYSIASGTAPKEETKLAFTVDLGVPFVVLGDETSKFFIRPGFTFASTPSYDTVDSKWITMKDLWVSGTLGVEHFFGKRFSVQVGHGLVFKSHDPGISGSKKQNEITSEAFGLSNIGFHFYFN